MRLGQKERPCVPLPVLPKAPVSFIFNVVGISTILIYVRRARHVHDRSWFSLCFSSGGAAAVFASREACEADGTAGGQSCFLCGWFQVSSGFDPASYGDGCAIERVVGKNDGERKSEGTSLGWCRGASGGADFLQVFQRFAGGDCDIWRAERPHVC